MAENLIKFEIEGPGSFAGLGNANPRSLESYQSPERKAWQGKCLVIIKASTSPGIIKLKAISEGMNATSININAE